MIRKEEFLPSILNQETEEDVGEENFPEEDVNEEDYPEEEIEEEI